MAQSVIILGAGASMQAGAPLMNDFIDKAERLRALDLCGRYESDFDSVFEGLYELSRALAKGWIDLDNLEAVFGAFDLAALCGSLGDLASDKVEGLPRALKNVIVRTLECSIGYPTYPGHIDPPLPYGPFVSWLRSVAHDTAGSVAILTFNYDLALEYALYTARTDGVKKPLQVDYGFGNINRPAVPILKVHGSLNWLECKECSSLVPVPWNRIREVPPEPHPFRPGESMREISVCLEGCQCAAGHELPPEPFLVPPTWNKRVDGNRDFTAVWRRAASELRQAEAIFVCGHSLAPTDLFLRYIYSLGTISSTRLKKFCIFDPDVSVGERYQDMLGKLTKARFMHFTDNRGLFMSAQSTIRDEILDLVKYLPAPGGGAR